MIERNAMIYHTAYDFRVDCVHEEHNNVIAELADVPNCATRINETVTRAP